MKSIHRIGATIQTAWVCGRNFWKMSKGVDVRTVRLNITFQWK